ncbi:MAG: aldehyde dehydrogenase family protein [Campylobacterales bacterium]
MEVYLFGQLKEIDGLTSSEVEQIVSDAKEIEKKLAVIKLDDILNIFQKISDAWLEEDYKYRKIALEYLPEKIGFSKEMIAEGIKVMSSLLSRDGMQTRLLSDLEQMSYLDDWTYNKHFRGYIKAEPLGVVSHISAGNVFVGGVDSLIQGIVTKNVNIMKMSTVDPIFPVLFAKSLRDFDYTGVLHKAMALINWKGGTQDVENIIKKKCDAIVVYGGADTIRAYRKNLGLHCKLIEYGPKYSFVMVEKEMLYKRGLKESAKLIAKDAIMWEQSACSSPHTVYVEGRESAEELLIEIGKAFDEWADEIPQGTVYGDEAVEITKVRELAKVNKALGDGDYYFSKKNLSTIVYQSSTEFQVSCHNRTLFLKAVDTLDDVIDIVAPMGEYIQTVAILASNQKSKELSLKLASFGADRFVEIGRMSSRKHGTPHDGTRGLSELIRWVSLSRNDIEIDWQVGALWSRYNKHDDGFDYLPNSARDSLTLNRIKRVVDIAKQKSPILSKRYDGVEFNSFEGFRKIPFMNGDDYKKHLPPSGDGILTEDASRSNFIFSSGGTTGAPKNVYRTTDEQYFNAVRLGKGLALSVFNESDTVANLLFAGNMWASFISFTQALEHTGCTILPIAGNHSMEEIVNNLILYKSNAIITIPSVLLSLAEYVQTNNIDLKIKKVATGGEHLFKEAKDYLRKTLGVEHFASTGYTTNDTGAIGYQCEYMSGVEHHVHEDLHFVEILDMETNEPITDGSIGKIVVTNLQRTLMPTIRYEVGDVGRWIEKECKCGRKTRIFELLGRGDDIVIIGGGNITPDIISTAIYEFESLSSHFQMLIRLDGQKDELTVIVEAKEDSFEDISDSVKEAILNLSKELRVMSKEGLISEVKVKIVKPNSLQRNSKTGKLKLILDERTLQ